MTEYNTIFGVILLANVLVTFRASSYWKVYGPGGGDSGKPAGEDDEPTPLIGGGDGDVEKGEGSSDKGHSAASDAAADIRHSQLLRKYLVVYLLAAFSDWLQGPYVSSVCPPSHNCKLQHSPLPSTSNDSDSDCSFDV